MVQGGGVAAEAASAPPPPPQHFPLSPAAVARKGGAGARRSQGEGEQGPAGGTATGAARSGRIDPGRTPPAIR